jgi:hypothetical protein
LQRAPKSRPLPQPLSAPLLPGRTCEIDSYGPRYQLSVASERDVLVARVMFTDIQGNVLGLP